MFSADADARALASFIPSPSSMARYNFAILGKNITFPNETAFFGTSFATMIRETVAARILDFSRHSDNREKIWRIDKLRTVEGTSEMFRNMVGNAVENHYHCISPWKILPPEIHDEDPKKKRLRERAHTPYSQDYIKGPGRYI